MFEEETEIVEAESEFETIYPLRDFVIKMNEFYYDIKEGEEIEVHKMFLPNLKTEKVIK